MKINPPGRPMDNFNVNHAKAALGHLEQYGTYTYARIQELQELKRSFLAGNNLDKRTQLELAEYLLLSGQLSRDQAVPYEAKLSWTPPKNPRLDQLNDIVIDIKDGNSVGFGRSVGMYCNISSRSEWAFTSFIPTLLLKAGGNIMEIGPGHSYGAIKYASDHPDKNIITIDANALNIMGAYQNLKAKELIRGPVTNLKIMLGDICSTKLPPQQHADLVIAQSVINRSGNDTMDAMILKAMVINSVPSAKLIIIPGTGPDVRSFISAITGKKFTTEIALPGQRRADIYI